MNLSKSKYCKGLQCKKMLWLEKYKPDKMTDLNNTSVLEQGNIIHEVARYLFGRHINIEYTENLNQMISDTYNTIESYNNIIITEASFNYKNNFCSVDILKKNGERYEIYEVKSGTELKDIYINDASYQYYILTNLGMKVTKCSIILLNSKYIRHGELELDKLFIKEDITKEVINLQTTVKEKIKEINEYMNQELEPSDDIDLKCFKPYDCPFFKYCTNHIPSDNVFDIAGMHTSKKINLYKEGKYTYQDLLNSDISNKYIEQIEFKLYNKPPFINKETIKEFLNKLYYPLYFLDFESYQQPIPLYDNISPYMQIPFQYSLHYIENENGKIFHKEFLSAPNIDPRRILAERLIEDIPKNSCILAYNMMFEKTIIKNLANLYEDLSEHLMNIHDNIQDLMIIFQKRAYYTKEMEGSYSIKYVLPALFPNDPELDYHNLELIHNGSEASNNYASYGMYDKETQEKIKKALLKYCELDTYAMVKIWQKLIEVTKE